MFLDDAAGVEREYGVNNIAQMKDTLARMARNGVNETRVYEGCEHATHLVLTLGVEHRPVPPVAPPKSRKVRR